MHSTVNNLYTFIITFVSVAMSHTLNKLWIFNNNNCSLLCKTADIHNMQRIQRWPTWEDNTEYKDGRYSSVDVHNIHILCVTPWSWYSRSWIRTAAEYPRVTTTQIHLIWHNLTTTTMYIVAWMCGGTECPDIMHHRCDCHGYVTKYLLSRPQQFIYPSNQPQIILCLQGYHSLLIIMSL